MVNVEPASVAVTLPEPVIFDAVEVSTGTGLSRPRNLVAGGVDDWASRASAMNRAVIALHGITRDEGLGTQG